MKVDDRYIQYDILIIIDGASVAIVLSGSAAVLSSAPALSTTDP